MWNHRSGSARRGGLTDHRSRATRYDVWGAFDDDEITRMFQVAKILDDLDQEARARLLRWAADKYGIDMGQPAPEDVESTDQTISGGVEPDRVAAARGRRGR